jgi:hypothetical protein
MPDLRYKLFIEELEEEVNKRKSPALLRSSHYRDTVLEFVDILRTKGYKYRQIKEAYMDSTGVCAMGLWIKERLGDTDPWKIYYDPITGLGGLYHRGLGHAVARLNDDHGSTFAQIADELERGVSIIQ